MSLSAVLFDVKGVIIDDQKIQQELIADVLIRENLRPDADDFQTFCLGKSDRQGLKDVLKSRGRVVAEEYLNKLSQEKSTAYINKLSQLEKLPFYSGFFEFLTKLQEQEIVIGLVTGTSQQETEFILRESAIADFISIVINADHPEIASKPLNVEPNYYAIAIEIINQQFSQLNLQPQECLVIESTYPRIAAAQKLEMQVVGISNQYPLHMLQRKTDWTVDYLADIDIDRINQVLSQQQLTQQN